MIQSFSVNNYKSIKDLLTIDLTSKNQIIKEEHESLFLNLNGSNISRLNFLYGKNGSGKSTIRDALSSFVSLIMAREDEDRDDLFLPIRYRYRGGFNITPFKLSETLDPNTFFSLTFHTANNLYRYSVIYDSVKRAIKEEKLEQFDKEFKIIFDKTSNTFNRISLIEKERLNTYKLDKITILNVLKTKFELSDEMFKFHINNVYTFFKSISFDFISIQADSSLRLLNKEKKYLTKIISKIKDFDLSIETIKLNTRQVSYDEFKRRFSGLENKIDNFEELIRNSYEQEKIEYDLKIVHNNKGLEFREESAGTQHVINILFSLYASNKKVWVIDDFENYLHTEAATQLIIYLAKNLFDMQFILVTHELSFLNLGAIHNKAAHYFVTKDDNDLSTSVVNLTQFSDLRNDERNNWEQFYRNYRLGQYPYISLNTRKKIDK